ncbi:MAG: PadR family transcriptional regulator, regulatory protein PadR [Actinomycetota bacterium]|nr:PadR family transcriptional regulator, regulatory protein PadR [Actinomycetota bacterium]
MASEQLLKGVLDIVALAVLSRDETYGYAIVQQLHKAGLEDVAEASVYGTLRRLEQQDWVTSRLVASALGPARRYYRLTRLGKRALESLLLEWDGITEAVESLARPEEGRR